ncbi:hypothetical protein [Cystobacter ferrugineus]|uniref:Uncharacterized protein n=1 Tax=Cystobacter ferrugineus TaxID=83449 RepID=A0A1L9B7N5_9BACT|nr:hypothetical protein [Cystobacter ferrugineus]OJH38261.1 hypothetical protein BON30_24280 [Cystobacter ferrugineus]
MTETDFLFPWHQLAASEAFSERASLTLGLRSADLHFRELVVPGLGRAWFLRQLSWPLAALTLHAQVKAEGARGRTPTDLAHGIEALACKLEHASGVSSDRIIGVRAFNRDGGRTWDYEQLRTRAHYVQNTYRQAAVRAIRTESGLGLASGFRFGSMRLTSVGMELAQAFLAQPAGTGKQTLERWLERWIDGQAPSWGTNLTKALAPTGASEEEREIVWKRLVGTNDAAGHKRRALAEIFLGESEFPDIERDLLPELRKRDGAQQSSEIALARSFGSVFSTALRVLGLLTRVLERAKSVSPADAASLQAIRIASKALREAASDYRRCHDKLPGAGSADASSFVDQISRCSGDSTLLEFIVSRDEQVLQLSDGEIHRGPLFRVLDDEESRPEEHDGTTDLDARSDSGRTFRLANLFSLVQDCDMESLP